MPPLASLHDRIPNGVDADIRVLFCRGNDWIQTRRGSFSDILLHLRNRAREIPVRNCISLCDYCLKGESEPRRSLHAFVERLWHRGVDFVEAVSTVKEGKIRPSLAVLG